MANPQKENGYTPIANEILEEICRLKLNGNQFKILLLIWRYTYGFSRKECSLSDTFLAKAMKSHRVRVNQEMNKLVDQRIIEVIKEATFTSPKTIRFNKNYSEWMENCYLSAKQHTGSESVTTTGSESVTTTGSENATESVSESATQDKQYIKQNIKQYTKQKEPIKKSDKKSYYPLDEKLNDAILDFIDFRKSIKASMTDHAIDLLLKKLDKMTSDNDEKIEILNQSIISGWKGIFELKNKGNSAQYKQKQTMDDFNHVMDEFLGGGRNL